ncbi:MAG: hypothetical protein OEW40_05715, partial [Cyclobacteriaceae bacterium]|nr:hypothetical protein [Cyclobacteriaceae bacterium]
MQLLQIPSLCHLDTWWRAKQQHYNLLATRSLSYTMTGYKATHIARRKIKARNVIRRFIVVSFTQMSGH